MLLACGGDDDGGDDSTDTGAKDGGGASSTGATHAEALAVLNKGTCAIASCHGSSAEAGLRFDNATNLNTLLVGVTACEAPSLKLVEAGNPAKSWLYIKLTAAHDSSGKLTSQSAWGASGTCSSNPGVGFGNRMPDVSPWSDWTSVGVIESWIKGGAPGPT